MSYDTMEQSRTKGEPITFYHFYYINNEQFYYTDAEKVMYIPGLDIPFQPAAIDHGRLKSNGNLGNGSLDIQISRDAKICEGFRVSAPDEVVNVIIRQMHLDDPIQQALVVWSGRVLGSSFKNDVLTMNCEPISTSLKRTGLRRPYQLSCPHVLYGDKCRANKANATLEGVVVDYTDGSSLLHLGGNWLPASWIAAGRTIDKFTGGLIVWEYETEDGIIETKRTILNINGISQVSIAGSSTGIKAGTVVKLILGCNHQMSDCEYLHNNIKRFGGFPWIPLKSPFGTSNNYY